MIKLRTENDLLNYHGVSIVCLYVQPYVHHETWKCIGSLQYDSHVLVIYRQTYSIRRTDSQNINVSRHVLLLSLSNPLKPDVKSRMM